MIVRIKIILCYYCKSKYKTRGYSDTQTVYDIQLAAHSYVGLGRSSNSELRIEN